MDRRSAVLQMLRVERLSRSFGLIFSDLVSATEEVSASPFVITSRTSLASLSTPPDVSMLIDTLHRLQVALNAMTEGQLSANSISQMNEVFVELQNTHLWQHIFDRSSVTSAEWKLVQNLRNSFQELIDAKLLWCLLADAYIVFITRAFI